MKNTIQLDTHYTRSINLERDANSSDSLRAYIPTSRALQTLDKIAETFNQHAMPRAWSLVGSYGAGKSSFAAFLAHLLENRDTRIIAEQKLQHYNRPLADKITDHTNETSAYCIVLLTGSSESLSKRFVEALHQAAQRYWKEERTPDIVHELGRAKQQQPTITEILALLKKLQLAVSKKAGLGILIVIDELGKFLEYEARHQGVNDIFLLQAIAEHAAKGNQANILLVVLMHQAFEQYAKSLGETQRHEWSKVQGRFETIPFLESAEQTLRVMAAAFSNNLNPEQQQDITQQTVTIANVLAKQNALVGGLTVETASDILSACYPLHPMATLILPTLCQKVAQNERTLFSYLGSQEAFGFKDSIEQKHIGEWVLPWEIFQYFIENQPLATTDHLTHRRWIEVLTAIERLGDAEELEIQLLKTIGLFNIIGSQAGFKASNELLALCFPNAAIEHLLNQLIQKSIINYRKFNSEYRIWEGSDFDLEVVLSETVQQSGRFDLAETLERRGNTYPIVARKYSIKNATLRYFQPHYVDANTKFTTPEQPSILFFLSENPDDNAVFHATLTTHNDPLSIYVLCENAAQVKAVLAEVIALEKIQSEHAEIKSDRVAQRELKDYLEQTKAKETELLNHYLEHPEDYQWFWRGEKLALPSRKQLQNQLSTVLETVYHQAPLIKNELVNRNKTSGQANAAKNKLIAALLSNAHSKDLGFEANKYPAEKTIYRAVLKETGIHIEKNGVWQLVKPPKDNPYQLINVWNGIEGFLKGEAPKKLTDLYAFIEKPPYGVQKGVSSLIFAAYYLANQKFLGLYESGVFCPTVTQEVFEILAKRPELFSVEAFDLTDIRADLFNGYLETLIGKVPEDNTLLDIIKPLAKFINDLPAYTKATKSLDQKTTAVRDAFSQTQSPMKLLFETLPVACGYDSYIDNAHFNDSNPDDFLKQLVLCLNTLNTAYKNLLKDFQQQLTNALQESPDLTLTELKETLHKKYAGLEKYTAERQGLKAFIHRLQDNKATDTAWLESVAAMLGKAPPDKWRQANQADAEHRLMDFSERLLRLKKVHPNNNNDSNVFVVRAVDNQGENDQIVHLTEELKQQARQFTDVLKTADKQLNLAIIAEIMSRMR